MWCVCVALHAMDADTEMDTARRRMVFGGPKYSIITYVRGKSIIVPATDPSGVVCRIIARVARSIWRV